MTAPPSVSIPSAALWAAALAGLAGLTTACGNDPPADDLIDAAPADAAAPDAPDVVVDAAPDVDANPITSEVEGTRTFASVIAECDTLHGYTQLTAACSGNNSCAGFSYGDWDPGVTTYHTCAGLNGCNGISCVVLPADSGKTGQQIYEEDLPETGPRSCLNCHAEWSDTGPDRTKFKLWLPPGSTRTAANWLDTSAATQERVVAFGSTGRLASGAAFAYMRAYHKLYARAEIERVVQYIRTQLTVVPATIKEGDPGLRGGAAARRRPVRR